MAFQGRHQTRSGLHKVNLVLLEGKREDGGSLVRRGLIYRRSCPACSPSQYHSSAGSGSLLSASEGAIGRGRSIRSLLLGCLLLAPSQLCPLRCQPGAGSHRAADEGKSDQAAGQCPRPLGDSGSPKGARLQDVRAQSGCPNGQVPEQGWGEVCYCPVSPAAPLPGLASPTTAVQLGAAGRGKQQQLVLGDRRGFRV